MGIVSEIDCFHSKTSTIARIGKDNPNVAISLLVVMINDLADTFNIGKNMGAVQVMEGAQIIFNTHGLLKIADFALFFNKAKTGQYGKVYDRLDIAVICEWLNRFVADKEEQIEFYWKNEQENHNKENVQNLLSAATIADSDTAKEYIKKISDEIKKAKINNVSQILKTSKPIEINDIQKIHSKWAADFFNIWSRGERRSGKQFIKKYGRMIDVNEYLERKQYQHNLFLSR